MKHPAVRAVRAVRAGRNSRSTGPGETTDRTTGFAAEAQVHAATNGAFLETRVEDAARMPGFPLQLARGKHHLWF
jgi:hypothetical protein